MSTGLTEALFATRSHPQRRPLSADRPEVSPVELLVESDQPEHPLRLDPASSPGLEGVKVRGVSGGE